MTLQWSASLRPGAAFYWELPIPHALRKGNKLYGFAKLTAVLNPHPLASDFAGPNYFGARLETALQVTRNGKGHNLLGSLEASGLTETQARNLDHKWSPIRHHSKKFRGVSFEGNILRVYARTFARDLYVHGFSAMEEVPPLDIEFVLTLGTNEQGTDIYNEVRQELGSFVENAVVDSDIDLDIDEEEL